jgi:hypothetical protein
MTDQAPDVEIKRCDWRGSVARVRGRVAQWTLPPRLGLYVKAFRRVALPEWFVINSALLIGPHVLNNHGNILGLDARIYVRAAANWLHGTDPWAAYANIFGVKTDFHFSGLPPTVALYVPLTLVSEEVVVWLSIGIDAMAAVWIVRHLRLPLWWVLFPPIVQGVASGNPHIVLLACALSGWSVVAGLAPIGKIYFVVPLIAQFRIRALLASAGIVMLMLPWTASLWIDYLTRAGALSARLLSEAYGGYSAWIAPLLLVPPTAAALWFTWRRDRTAAGWLAVPGFWPASQWLYSTCALPVMTPIAAALFAIDMRGVPTIAVIVCCIELWIGHLVTHTSDSKPNSAERFDPLLRPEGLSG